jgi:hypothetical protein
MRRTKSIRRRTLSTKSPATDAIRVVPLHHPKPRLPIAKKGKADKALIEAWLQRAVAAKLTYRGGPLIEAAEVFSIFWGKSWSSVEDSKALIGQMNKFFDDILVSPLIDQLSEYNVPGHTIRHVIGRDVMKR